MKNIIKEFQEKTNVKIDTYPEDMIVNYLILGLLNDSEIIADTFIDSISEHPKLMTNEYANSAELDELKKALSYRIGGVFWHLIQLCDMLNLNFELILEQYLEDSNSNSNPD